MEPSEIKIAPVGHSNLESQVIRLAHKLCATNIAVRASCVSDREKHFEKPSSSAEACSLKQPVTSYGETEQLGEELKGLEVIECFQSINFVNFLVRFFVRQI